MKKMFQIAMLKIRLTFKEKSALPLMFIAPIVFVTIIAFGFNSGGSGEKKTTYPISIADLDQGDVSEAFIEALKADSDLVITITNDKALNKAVVESKTALGVIIPKGFSEAIEVGEIKAIELVKLHESESTMLLSSKLTNALLKLQMSKKTGVETINMLEQLGLLEAGKEIALRAEVEAAYLSQAAQPQIGVEVMSATDDQKENGSNLSSMAIGIIVLFIMFFVTQGASAIFEEKEMGTWGRVKATPTKDFSVLGGYILGNLFLGWIQVGVLILFSKYVFKINWGSSVLALMLLFTCFLISIIALGSALSTFVKTKHQLSALTTLIIMPTSLIAGCMWPAEIMPDIMLKIANFIPQRWVLRGMTDVITRNGSLETVLLPSFVLIVFSAVFFLIGLTAMRFQKVKA